jgi:RES domain-containing protein
VFVWRIARSAHQALDGEGARQFGGRWNSPGIPMLYTSQNLSLAGLELLVHVDPGAAPSDLVALRVEVPEDSGLSIPASELPDGWRDYPAPAWQAELGDLWIRDRTSLWLAVPSAVVPEEFNVLINPSHSGMRGVRTVETRPFRFDGRLLD